MYLQFRQKWILLFVCILILVQLIAFALQFYYGFFPGRKEPIRVSFSWDMFATKIERCNVTWSPPLIGFEPPLESLVKRSLPFEWPAICDPYEGCIEAAQWACQYRNVPTKFKVHCFVPEGRELLNEFDCTP